MRLSALRNLKKYLSFTVELLYLVRLISVLCFNSILNRMQWTNKFYRSVAPTESDQLTHLSGSVWDLKIQKSLNRVLLLLYFEIPELSVKIEFSCIVVFTWLHKNYSPQKWFFGYENGHFWNAKYLYRKQIDNDFTAILLPTLEVHKFWRLEFGFWLSYNVSRRCSYDIQRQKTLFYFQLTWKTVKTMSCVSIALPNA